MLKSARFYKWSKSLKITINFKRAIFGVSYIVIDYYVMLVTRDSHF